MSAIGTSYPSGLGIIASQSSLTSAHDPAALSFPGTEGFAKRSATSIADPTSVSKHSTLLGPLPGASKTSRVSNVSRKLTEDSLDVSSDRRTHDSSNKLDTLAAHDDPRRRSSVAIGNRDGVFIRSDTLLNFGASQTRNAADLKVLMGNSNARLKSGATVRSTRNQSEDAADDQDSAVPQTVSLEQAKTRARVEVDIILASDAFVQGSQVRGHIKLRIRKRTKKEAPVSIADGKIRVVGFECIPGDEDRHTFYQCASPLEAVTEGLPLLYNSSPDSEGFVEIIEGVHVLPFVMRLPSDGTFGMAKGVLNVHSGVNVRYIAMVSVKVKDTKSGKRSVAHFYRNCEVWPRLDLSVVLAPAPRPLQAATSKSLSVLSSGSKVKLTALMHRLTWVAGQRCYVDISVINETKKTVKTLTLTLIRTTTIFRPKPALDAGSVRSVDPDACQTSTMHKLLAETVLEMAQRGTKGHASAKGWWTGVGPGKELSFSHYILLPAEALSITRGRLLEVEYSIRVTLSAGSLSSDVHVTLPVRIVNFLSIDPAPVSLLHSPSGAHVRPLLRRRSIDGEMDSRRPSVTDWPSITRSGEILFQGQGSALYNHIHSKKNAPNFPQTQSGVRKARYAARAARTNQDSTISALHVMNPDRLSSTASSLVDEGDGNDSEASFYSTDESSYPSSADEFVASSSESQPRELGNLNLDEPDSDKEVTFILGRFVEEDDEDGVPGFRAGPKYGSCASRVSVAHPVGPRPTSHLERGRRREPRRIQHGAINTPMATTYFHQRVHEKLAALAVSDSDASANFITSSPSLSPPLLGTCSSESGSGPGSLQNFALHMGAPPPRDLSMGASDEPDTNACGLFDADATPRLGRGYDVQAVHCLSVIVPQVTVRPLRPSRHPARRARSQGGSAAADVCPAEATSTLVVRSQTPVSSQASDEVTYGDVCADGSMCSSVKATGSVRTVRELPHPPMPVSPHGALPECLSATSVPVCQIGRGLVARGSGVAVSHRTTLTACVSSAAAPSMRSSSSTTQSRILSTSDPSCASGVHSAESVSTSVPAAGSSGEPASVDAPDPSTPPETSQHNTLSSPHRTDGADHVHSGDRTLAQEHHQHARAAGSHQIRGVPNFRGRPPRVLARAMASPTRSVGTGSGSPAPSGRKARPTSVHAYSAAALARPLMGMQRAGSDPGEYAGTAPGGSAVAGRVAALEERMKTA